MKRNLSPIVTNEHEEFVELVAPTSYKGNETFSRRRLAV